MFEAGTTIWIRDFELLLDKLQQCFEKTEKYSKTLKSKTDEELKKIFDERAFVYPKEIIDSLEKYHIVLMKPNNMGDKKFN